MGVIRRCASETSGLKLVCVVHLSTLGTSRAVNVRVVCVNVSTTHTPKNTVRRSREIETTLSDLPEKRKHSNAGQQRQHVNENDFTDAHEVGGGEFVDKEVGAGEVEGSRVTQTNVTMPHSIVAGDVSGWANVRFLANSSAFSSAAARPL